MVPQTKATCFAVRASRFGLVTASALILGVGLSGCGHRRAAMRPVFGTPVQASPVTAAPADPSCPTGSTMTTVPDSSEPFLTPTTITPPSGARANGNGVIRAGGSPPVPDAADEPPLNAPDLTPTNPTSTGGGLSPSTRPSSSKNSTRRDGSTRRARFTLQDQVKPYVENPEDLFGPPKADRPWKYVVLHHSAGDEGGLDQIDRDHRKILGFEGCGYHFVIGNGTGSPDGRIEVADRWLNQKNGVHCRNGKTPDVNEYGIGICLIGNFDQSAPTPKQIAAAKALVAYLGDRYAIPSDHLGTHDQFANGPTACPGKNFPTEAIIGSSHVARR